MCVQIDVEKIVAEVLAPPACQVPLYIIPPLTPEQDAADLHRDRLKHRVTKRIEAMYRRSCIRHPSCGRRGAIHVQRPHQLGGVQSLVYRPTCKRLDCEYCQRARLAKILKRAATCVLDAPGERYLPRTANLYVLETTWSEWGAVDKRARRTHGGNVGRLRVHMADDTLLVVCEKPIRGSRPMPAHLVFDLVDSAIDRMHTKKNAYRQLGSFSDRQPTEWKLVEKTGACVLFDEAKKMLSEMGKKARLFRTSELIGLAFRAETSEAANAIVATIIAIADPNRGVSEYPHNDSQNSIGDTRTEPSARTPWECDAPIEYPHTDEWEPSRWAVA